jgi:hypothetical protein
MTTVVTVFLFILLAAVGLECFLRRTLPEHSLTAHVFQSLGTAGPIAFTSGRGFGHVLGYVGTSFMLLTLLYPMHTRLGFLKTLGAQSTWLKVHLWVGFIGATLVTYHAAFKLDRWVGLACMAMWMVVASGVMGRFLYAKVHSGMGLVEFKRLSKQAARQRTLHYLKSAEKVLRHWNYVHIALTILMFTLAAIHITYGFMYKAT